MKSPRFDTTLSGNHAGDFLRRLESVVGKRSVLTSPHRMRRFTKGYRIGGGKALAVVMPNNLLEMWEILRLCVAEGKVVLAQAANTGLTGGSTPHGDDYGRDVVIVSTTRMKSLHLLGGGIQVLAFPGSTLDELEQLLKPLSREPHSVIGSSCLGASVIGGICNNSGGSLINRGPAYTELALYAQVDANGSLELVNQLGIDLGDTPKEILRRLDEGLFTPRDVHWDTGRAASDPDYSNHVRDIHAPTAARFNADPRRLFAASGSAGHVIVFAVRLDTFKAAKAPKVFYIGTNRPECLTALRRDMLRSLAKLPIAAEYIHREAFDIADRYGKDTYLLVKWLGTGRLPRLFALKSRIDAFAEDARWLPSNLSDRILQWLGDMAPNHLPARLRQYRGAFEHHLMIKVAEDDAPAVRVVLERNVDSSADGYFECSPGEGAAAFLHRFATAGAAVRYRSINQNSTGGLVALDVALPRNELQWQERLPGELEKAIAKKLYYGHFFCYVFHQDYLIRKGENWLDVEHKLLALLDERNARYPAEHNFGHLYKADPVVAEHYRELDPCNCFNPGVGQTSKLRGWQDDRKVKSDNKASTGTQL